VNTQQALQHARSLDIEPIDAQTLLLHVMQRSLHDRAWLLLNDALELSVEQQTQYQQGLARLLNNEPLAYVTGWQSFHGLELQVTPDVLVPRPDSETLVDWALALGSAPSPGVGYGHRQRRHCPGIEAPTSQIGW
jgi:release factor glutamine methyltransferase